MSHQTLIQPNHFTIHTLSPVEVDAAVANGTWNTGPQPSTALPWAKLSKINVDAIMDKLGVMPSITKSIQKQIDARHAHETWTSDNQVLTHTRDYMRDLSERLGRDMTSGDQDMLGIVPMNTSPEEVDHPGQGANIADDIEALFEYNDNDSGKEADADANVGTATEPHYLLEPTTAPIALVNVAEQPHDTQEDDLLQSFLDAHPHLTDEIGADNQTARVIVSSFLTWTARRLVAHAPADDDEDNDSDSSASEHA